MTAHSAGSTGPLTPADLEACGRRSLAVRLGLEDLPPVEEAMATVVERWGRVDGLVANAVRRGGDGPPDPSIPRGTR